MAQTEATVDSAVKNWYINFFPYSNPTSEMPNGAKTMKFFAKSDFLDYKVFGALGPWAQGPWGPGTLGHRDPGAQGPWGPGTIKRRHKKAP